MTVAQRSPSISFVTEGRDEISNSRTAVETGMVGTGGNSLAASYPITHRLDDRLGIDQHPDAPQPPCPRSTSMETVLSEVRVFGRNKTNKSCARLGSLRQSHRLLSLLQSVLHYAALYKEEPPVVNRDFRICDQPPPSTA